MRKTGLLLLLLFVLGIFQTYLSKKKIKWIGLILPLITFGLSLFVLVISYDIVSFLLINIPTVIYLIVFFIYRDKSKQSELDKMNIQDLE